MNQDIYNTFYWQDDLIQLRPWDTTDRAYEYLNELDSEAMAFVNEQVGLPPITPSGAADATSSPIDASAPSFTIVNHTDEYVGHIHFNYINERHGTFSIGMIIHRSHRRKGYGKAAMKMLMQYAFHERRLHKFTGFCLDCNVGSSKMMESLGCTLEGRVREEVYLHGAYHDRLLYGLTADEFQSLADQ